MKEKLSKAFDQFEIEKKKIQSYYKTKNQETKKILENIIKEKDTEVENLKSELKNFKSTSNDQNNLKKSFKSNLKKEEEIEFLIEKFIKEKKEMEDTLTKQIEALNHNNLQLKVTHKKEVDCLSERIKQLETNLVHLKSEENRERSRYNLSEKNKENNNLLSNKSSTLITSQRFPKFGNYKIQLAEKETLIEILTQKCDLLEKENKTQTEKVNILLEKLSELNLNNCYNNSSNSESVKPNYDNSYLLSKREDRGEVEGVYSDFAPVFRERNPGLRKMYESDEMNYRRKREEVFQVLREKDEEIETLVIENRRLNERLRAIKESLFG